jgi:hypothetical protein
MSIAFSCPDCEKTFKVPDAMAGRKAKCSGCGATILIANVIGLTEKPTARIRSKAAIVKDDDNYQEEDAPPRKGRIRQDDAEDVDDELDDDDEEPTRKSRKRRGKSKKKKKSSAMLLALLVVGGVTLLVLAGAGGGLAWYFWPSSVDPAKFAPDNCKMVMVMNMEQLEGTPAYDALERESSKLNNQMFAGNNSSLKKSRVAQVQIFSAVGGGFAGGPNPIGGNPATNEQTVIVVKTKDSISVDDLRNDPTLKGPFTETKVNGYTLYEGNPMSFCRLNSRQVLLGPSGALRAVLNRDKKPEFSDNLKAAIDKADFSKPFAMAIDASEPPNVGGPKRGGADATETLWVAIQAVCGQDINLTIIAQSRTDRGAQQIKKQADGLVTVLKLVPGQKLFAGEPRITVAGSTLTADLTIKTDAFVQTIKQAKDNPFNAGGNPPGGNPGRPGW